MNVEDLTLASHSPEQTCRIAQALGRGLTTGDVLLLEGDVGAGKTHFARCLIQSRLAAPEDVPSPSYTLVQTYPVSGAEIWHADLYRLSDLSEVEELGLMQAFDEAICLVEWPDRLGELAPEQALFVRLDPGHSDSHRTLRFQWTAPRWSALMKGIARV